MPIPEGYTYKRCDIYTPDEFLSMYDKRQQRDICESYIKDHPKEYYNTDDEIAIHQIIESKRIVGLHNARHNYTTKKTWYTDS